MKRQRKDPLFDAGVRGMVVNMSKRQFFKVAGWYELDDLVQDGFMLWWKVRRHYPQIKEVRHLTSLFRTTFNRHIINLANNKRAVNEIAMSHFVSPDIDENDALDQLLGGHEDTMALALLRNMPYELKALWRFINSETGRRDLRRPYRKVAGVRETTNEFLCRILGFDADSVNFQELARQHFLGPDETQRQWGSFFKEIFAEL